MRSLDEVTVNTFLRKHTQQGIKYCGAYKEA